MKPNEDTAIRVRSAYGRTLEPGDTVFDEGDPGDHLYVIQSGEIELKRVGPSGHHVVAQLGPGDFFGELSLVPGQRRHARAVAVRKTRVLQLDRETLEAMCLAQPEIAMRLIRLLVARLVEAERRLAMLGVDDVLRPVVRALVRAAEPMGGGIGSGYRSVASLRQLAEQTGLSMLEAHRALHRLFDRRLLHMTEEGLVIPDLEGLSGCLDASE